MLPIVINLSGDCTQKCIFCHGYFKEGMNKDNHSWYFNEIKKKILVFIGRKSFTECMLIGNEPTNFTYFFEFLEFLNNLGIKDIYIQTTGERFSDYDFAKKCYDLGVKGLYIPIYGDDEIHDKVTGKDGAYFKLKQAIENISKIGIKYYFHTILIKQNYPFSFEGVFKKSRIIAHYPYKDNKLDYKLFSIKLSDINEYDKNNILPFRIPCLKIGMSKLDKILINYSKGHIGNKIKISPYKIEIEKQNKIFYYGKKCDSCAYKNNLCTGVYKEYLDLHGDNEFNPI
nr:radical SAM protein [Candidatus Gracilibacteria bacterium]